MQLVAQETQTANTTASIILILVWLIGAITKSGVLVASFASASTALASSLQKNQKQSSLLFSLAWSHVKSRAAW